jgi:hypothetical protein
MSQSEMAAALHPHESEAWSVGLINRGRLCEGGGRLPADASTFTFRNACRSRRRLVALEHRYYKDW